MTEVRSDRVLVAPGELRPDLLRLLEIPPAGLDCMLCAPGLMPVFEGYEPLVREPARPLPRGRAFAHRRALLEYFATGLDRLPKTAAWEQLIQRWLEAVRRGDIRVRHFAEHPVHSRLLSLAERSVVPQGPLLATGEATNVELSLELTGAEHHRARTGFTGLFDRATELGPDLAAVLDASWAGAWCSAEDAYFKTLAEYFSGVVHGLDREGDDNPMLEYLTEFQVEAYIYARTILGRFGGVFLADVVGLGKTYIALALLSHLQRRYGEHAVVVAPPAVCPTWKDLADEFRIQLTTVSVGKLEDLEKYSDREVLVIDESHHFRHTGTQRYENLSRWLRPEGAASSRKVLLLSATPQNNSANDVKHQLSLFPDNYARLPFAGESLDVWFREVTQGRASLVDMLQHVVVRRTRNRIREAYPRATLRVKVAPGRYEERPLVFPRRVSGDEQILRYDIETVYRSEFYETLLHAIQTMRYPLYGLGDYVRPEAEADPRVTGLRRTGTALRGLFKVLLLKRLESSGHALAVTLGRLGTRLQGASQDLDRGVVRIGADQRHVELAGGWNADDPDAELLAAGGRTLEVSLFDVERLRADLLADSDVVGRALARTEESTRTGDAKLERLIAYLGNRPPDRHRTIVFTQFADTAKYLHEHLSPRFSQCEMVTGSSPKPLSIARRFAPLANRIAVSAEQQIRLLISSDALSEGVNLQDADTLVNYDIHWNPVRLIQRAGRIDRIGSEHEEIHVASFLPERTLERNLRLEDVLRRRIQEFVEVFGEDSHVLPSSERLEVGEVLDAYSGVALQDDRDSDDLDGLSRHADRLLRLRRDEPERFARILDMRTGRRAIGGGHPSVISTRQGWYWCFWSPEESENLKQLDVQHGLDQMYRHVREATDVPADAAVGVGLELMEAARQAFEPIAARVVAQQLEPRMSTEELFVLDQLERAAPSLSPNRRALLDDLVAWVRSGRAQLHLRRAAKIWRREKLAPVAIVDETRVLFARFPPRSLEIGEPEIVSAILRR